MIAQVTALEDRRRHLDDERANSCLVDAARDGAWVPTPWRDVHVGDVLCVRRGETMPADAVCLSVEAPGSADRRSLYVETSQLDGETNLVRPTRARCRAVVRHTHISACVYVYVCMLSIGWGAETSASGADDVARDNVGRRRGGLARRRAL